ncbi:hypothetical protein CC86DRAFT_402772 [Ophiobolus disseminans]|uniref:Uncharacterized protein n=1 Tax=Ophiobolus disseminans TaxID=1469910 RepID=A0A6A7AC80_9PLEO|nr:hypothetical protein CC86DRAFT_402772 [Ophiobolus disseminans]
MQVIFLQQILESIDIPDLPPVNDFTDEAKALGRFVGILILKGGLATYISVVELLWQRLLVAHAYLEAFDSPPRPTQQAPNDMVVPESTPSMVPAGTTSTDMVVYKPALATVPAGQTSADIVVCQPILVLSTSARPSKKRNNYGRACAGLLRGPHLFFIMNAPNSKWLPTPRISPRVVISSDDQIRLGESINSVQEQLATEPPSEVEQDQTEDGGSSPRRSDDQVHLDEATNSVQEQPAIATPPEVEQDQTADAGSSPRIATLTLHRTCPKESTDSLLEVMAAWSPLQVRPEKSIDSKQLATEATPRVERDQAKNGDGSVDNTSNSARQPDNEPASTQEADAAAPPDLQAGVNNQNTDAATSSDSQTGAGSATASNQQTDADAAALPNQQASVNNRTTSNNPTLDHIGDFIMPGVYTTGDDTPPGRGTKRNIYGHGKIWRYHAPQPRLPLAKRMRFNEDEPVYDDIWRIEDLRLKHGIMILGVGMSPAEGYAVGRMASPIFTHPKGFDITGLPPSSGTPFVGSHVPLFLAHPKQHMFEGRHRAVPYMPDRTRNYG